MDFLKEPGVVSGYPDYTVVLYLVYVALSLGLAIWVGQTLFRNGRVFLVDAFGGREALADAINHLLLVGFYLINIGYISFALTSEGYVESWRELLEVLSRKIGLVAIILGCCTWATSTPFGRFTSMRSS
jgi:hypothetical protein